MCIYLYICPISPISFLLFFSLYQIVLVKVITLTLSHKTLPEIHLIFYHAVLHKSSSKHAQMLIMYLNPESVLRARNEFTPQNWTVNRGCQRQQKVGSYRAAT